MTTSQKKFWEVDGRKHTCDNKSMSEPDINQNLQPLQFYHGTSSTFRKGKILTGEGANTHGRYETGTPTAAGAYFTDDLYNARKYAMRASSQNESPKTNIYKVEPLGDYHRDTHDAAGYHTNEGLRVVGKVVINGSNPPRRVW